MKTILLATAIILAPAGIASAADIGEGVAAYDWSGLYAGVHFGYVAGKSNFFIAGAGVGGTDVNAPLDPSGFIGGVHIGVNQELADRFVLGAEADLAYNNVDGLGTFTGAGALLKTDLKWSGSARLRAGYAFDRTLPYITAGVAAAKYEMNVIATTGTIPIHDETHLGWTVGAGIEHAFTDRWIARVEYRYSDFGKKDISVPLFGPGTVANIDLRTHDVRAGLSYKF